MLNDTQNIKSQVAVAWVSLTEAAKSRRCTGGILNYLISSNYICVLVLLLLAKLLNEIILSCNCRVEHISVLLQLQDLLQLLIQSQFML